MTKELQIRVTPQVAYSEQNIADYVSREIGIDRRTITHVRVLKKSIDARQRQIYVNLTLRIYINEEPADEAYVRTEYPDVSKAPQVIVVGEGPCGLFAALRLIELGLRPVILERGKDVRERKKDLALIKSQQRVDPESNYCFGEGGAGAYSDGKLYTRSKKRGNIEKILNVFCQFGASTSILSDAHPHIGTDKLPRVIENMRKQILASGGEVHFQTKMTELLIKDGRVQGVVAEVQDSRFQVQGSRVQGSRVQGNKDSSLFTLRSALPLGSSKNSSLFYGPVILATGHSARDVYRYLSQADAKLIEPKGIAVGVRLEHPSEMIDKIQYHSSAGRGKYLPAAEYSFVTQVDGRGVYSFCMCPGGFVIPAATDKEQIVVNGMSPSDRNGQWSNSGMVVEVRPEDVSEEKDALCMMKFQEELERMCWQQGNMKQTAPAQRMSDFVNGRLSYDLPKTSYAPGVISSPLHFWLPKSISHRLQEGFKTFGKQRHGFLTNEALMIGVETRTSAPVRITRDQTTMQSIAVMGLFPAGEGAGYAGGIVSAAIDGERAAEMVKELLTERQDY